jgi:hypothetical protein
MPTYFEVKQKNSPIVLKIHLKLLENLFPATVLKLSDPKTEEVDGRQRIKLRNQTLLHHIIKI